MGGKVCSKCNINKPIDEFYTHQRDGHQSWCKSCNYKYVKAWAKTPTRKKHRQKMGYNYRMNAQNKQALKSRRKLNAQIEMGNLQRQPCQVCQQPNAQAHHPDYSKPYGIIWLCEIHHRERSC